MSTIPQIDVALTLVTRAARLMFADALGNAGARAEEGVRSSHRALLAHLFRPSLYYVRPFSEGTTPGRMESIEAGDVVLFRAWYVKKEPTALEAATAQRVLADGRQKCLWIACGCRPELPHDPPVLSCVEVELGAGVYTPRRRLDRTPHAWFCFFYSKRAAEVATTEAPDAHRVRPPVDLLRGHGVRDSPAQRTAHGKQADATPRSVSGTASTHAALMHVIKLANCDSITAGRSYRGEVYAVVSAAAKLHHRSVPSLTLAKCLALNPSRPEDPDLLQRLFEPAAALWPRNELPVAYLLTVASALFKNDDGTFSVEIESIAGWRRRKKGCAYPVLKRSTITFDCPIRVAEPPGECIRAPYLLFLRAELSTTGVPMWIEGVAQPIASRNCWVPVPSMAERQAVDVMRDVAAELDAAGVEHDMRKRIGTMKNEAGETCEPDFTATKLETAVDEKPLLLETQKTGNLAYHARKEKQHRIMGDIGMLYVDDRQKHSRTVADRNLRQRLRRFYGLDEDSKPDDLQTGASGSPT